MWSDKQKQGVLWFILLLVGGCGFSPQYLTEAGKLEPLLQKVQVAPIPDRYGQILRNNLLNFIGENPQSDGGYQLNVALKVQERDIGYNKDLSTSRVEVEILADYIFTDQKNKVELQKGRCRTAEYFTFSRNKLYQNVVTERHAPLYGLDLISRCLIDRVSLLVRQANHLQIKRGE